MSVSYSSKSIYYKTPQNDFSLQYYVHRDIPQDSTDRYVMLDERHQFKPTVLSYDLYGDPAYWWTFSILNMDQIKDPIRDFQTGTKLRVATLDRLKKVIG